MKLNLRTKLIGSFIVVLLLLAVVGLVGVYTSRHIENHLEDIVEQDVKTANILGVVARRVSFIHSNSLMHIFTRSVEDMDRYESEIADWKSKINTDLDTLESTFKDQAALDKLAEFRADWELYLRIWSEQVIPLSRANRDEETFELVRKRGAAGLAAQEAMYKLDELHDVIIATAEDGLELAEQDFRKGQNILLAVFFLTITIGLYFGIKQSSLIAGAVNTVSEAAKQVAAGDLDQSVILRTGDEIESMAYSFNTMTSNMKKMVEELRNEIAERKRVEEALQESEQWLSTTLRSIGDAVIATDVQGLVTFMNPVAEDLTGWGEAESAGKPLEDVLNIINEQTGERAENPVARVLREGMVVGLANHTVLIAKDGTKWPIADSGAPIRDKEGNIVGTVMVFRDITEAKQAEEELKKHRDYLEELVEERTQALLESEARYSVLFETAQDSIFLSDETGKLIDVNQAACKLLGYSKEELLKLCNKEIDADPRGYEAFLKLRNGEEDHIMFEVNQRRKDGMLLPVEITGSFFTIGGQRVALAIARDITERKRAAKALREREHDLNERVKELDCLYSISNLVEKPGILLEEILQGAVDSILIAFQYSEITCARIVLESQEVKTENFGETAWKLSSDIVVHGERIGSLEVCYLEEKPEADEGPFLKEEISLINAVVEQLRRIVEHKRAEERERKAVAAAAAAQTSIDTIKAMSDGVFLLNLDGKIISVNPAFERMMGYKASEIVEQSVAEMIPKWLKPEDIEKTMGLWRTAAEGKTPVPEALTWITKDGREFPIIFAVSFIKDTEDNPNTVVIAIKDISELKRAGEALQESEEKLSSFINSAPDAFVLYDPELNLVQINKYGTEMLGLGKQDIGKNMLEISPGIKGTERYDRYLEVLKTGKMLSIVDLVPHPKFGDIQLALRAFKVGESLGFVVTDTTERKEMQERLVRTEKLAVLGQLAGGVGHELRNPLGAIKNAAYFLNMVLSEGETEPEVKETLEILEKEVETSEGIISSLLDYARTKPPILRKVDINEVLQEALSRAAVPDDPRVEIASQLDEALPAILADPNQLAQVFGNIILNGIQAMTEGGRLVVKTAQLSSPKSEWVVVSITDTGVGISREVLGKLFEPLFTTKAKGIGLGLAVTKILVEGHRGTIEVESEEGKGSTFTVRLPMGREEKK